DVLLVPARRGDHADSTALRGLELRIGRPRGRSRLAGSNVALTDEVSRGHHVLFAADRTLDREDVLHVHTAVASATEHQRLVAVGVAVSVDRRLFAAPGAVIGEPQPADARRGGREQDDAAI